MTATHPDTMAKNVTEASDHYACVDAWMERARGLPPDRFVRAFEAGFGSVWRRARLTLGDVTLSAIVDRVLYVAAERYPTFASVTIDDSGLRAEDLHQRAGTVPNDQLADGVRFVLVELLTVLGNLSADILTPSLHAELSKVATNGPAASAAESQRNPGVPKGNYSEDTES